MNLIVVRDYDLFGDNYKKINKIMLCTKIHMKDEVHEHYKDVLDCKNVIILFHGYQDKDIDTYVNKYKTYKTVKKTESYCQCCCP